MTHIMKLLAALLCLNLFFCATMGRSALGMKDTNECKRMEEVCRKSKEYKKMHGYDTSDEKIRTDPQLKALEDACYECMHECSESQKSGRHGYEK